MEIVDDRVKSLRGRLSENCVFFSFLYRSRFCNLKHIQTNTYLTSLCIAYVYEMLFKCFTTRSEKQLPWIACNFHVLFSFFCSSEMRTLQTQHKENIWTMRMRMNVRIWHNFYLSLKPSHLNGSLWNPIFQNFSQSQTHWKFIFLSLWLRQQKNLAEYNDFFLSLFYSFFLFLLFL